MSTNRHVLYARRRDILQELSLSCILSRRPSTKSPACRDAPLCALTAAPSVAKEDSSAAREFTFAYFLLLRNVNRSGLDIDWYLSCTQEGEFTTLPYCITSISMFYPHVFNQLLLLYALLYILVVLCHTLHNATHTFGIVGSGGR